MKSSDIYWGALPWVGLQLILVAIIIFFPQTVTYFIDQPMQAMSNSLISVDPLKDVIENENTIDSSAEIMRQFKENK